MIGAILSTAARASGPLASRCTTAPLRTSSAMIAVMLRAFACRSPSWSLIVDSKAFREIRQHRRRSRMQAGRIRNDDCIRGDRFRSFRRAAFFRRAKRREERVLSGHDMSAGAFPVRDAIAVRDDDLREQALRVGGEKIEIELDERRASAHGFASLTRG